MKEFIKVGKNWLIKDSNGFIISDEQKKQYEKNQLNIDHKPCECDKPVNKNKKHFKKVEVQNDTIKEAEVIKR